ncbi:2OG-Fe(II) oxygenase [Luteimonas sp BLCC-B24]|uniref:2OG-Fe(II) oxygenase n=1 Tax=Luteimonas sp. BLCC-B24 TaxID=3025317 RepID=UPI00234E1966|nr:2OG-Fe(II) oxygenase [Luteimonas sp. BLCC-B24]MDC7805680.1 2OG-Fe(II) oxygenase [Luteimonas sp. BLCC-B24]
MNTRQLSAEQTQWVVARALAGADPDSVLAPLRAEGWDEQAAIDAVQRAVTAYIERNAEQTGLPLPVRVPVPVASDAAALLDGGDRQVQVLASLKLPRVLVLGGLLADDECDALIELARVRLRRSTTVDPRTGGDQVHEDRTSRGTCFTRGQNALCARIEARIARLVDWPLDHGEGLQVLNYGPGAEYRPHHDYFDPAEPGSRVHLARGGQRVASVVMYLNTPGRGGATTFPDVHFEVAAVKGNAVFFSYDRPHPMTRTLHAGAPVIEGEKWIATKWLRAGRHD